MSLKPLLRGRSGLCAWIALLSLFAAALTGCGATSHGSPASETSGVTLTNCGVKVHVARPPTRAISLNQGATELMLTLGLQKSMIGTAYLDDHVLPSLQKAYESVPVLSKEYPSPEAFLAKEPDFAIASYASAFESKEGVGSRASLAKLGIQTYLTPDGCTGASTTTPWTFADDFSEIRQVASLFGVEPRAQQVIAAQEAALKKTLAPGLPGKDVRILWWDSEKKSPYIGACCGGPNLIMSSVGATNVFADTKGNWENVDWESVIARDPEVIVLVNASWDTVQSKLEFIAHDPALQALPAVQKKRFVVIPFSDSTPGVRNVEGVELLAAGLHKLHLSK